MGRERDRKYKSHAIKRWLAGVEFQARDLRDFREVERLVE
jgi:hypothetical protein